MHNPKVPKGNPKSKGKRYSLILRGVYSELLDDMVEKGVYIEPQAALRAGLRLLFEHHGVELYVKNSAD
ncbi:hypothetical protein ES705_37172 [subsurface metagenome]